MNIRISSLLLMTLALTGCWQKSASPFYTAGDVVAEPALAGVWQEPKDNHSSGDNDKPLWEFVAAGGNRFDVVIRTKDEHYEYDGFVFKLGHERFLDLGGQVRSVGSIPAHHLFKLVATGPELKLAALSTDWMQKWLRNHPRSLAHISVVDPEHRDDRDHDERILTADTAALQKFVREHTADEGFFAGPIVLKRQSNAAPAGEKK